MQQMYSGANLRIMRGMYGRRGVKFMRESDLEKKPPSRTIIASLKDPIGDTWVAVGPREEFNPAEIDLIEQVLVSTMKGDPLVREKVKEAALQRQSAPTTDSRTERAAQQTFPSPISTRVMEAVAEPGMIKKMAIASLVLSVSALPASIVGCGLLFPMFAVILGLIAFVQARKMGSPRNTRNMALAGVILGGLLNLVLIVILVISQLK